MLGLIFMTWEKYLAERFGERFLQTYRNTMGEAAALSLVASRYYDDDLLVQGVSTVSKLAHIPTDALLREYGRYYIINGLTGKLCAYLLTGVHSGRELLLAMRDSHAHLRTAFEGATPPVFEYVASQNPNEVILLYRSERRLCSVLQGAIEGAALRYNEQVRVVERTCMNKGAAVCRFEARFSAHPQPRPPATEQAQHQHWQRQLADLILTSLPFQGKAEGWTLTDIRALLASKGANGYYQRPAVMLEAVQHLQFAGLVMTNANEQTDTMMTRRYWRIHPLRA